MNTYLLGDKAYAHLIPPLKEPQARCPECANFQLGTTSQFRGCRLSMHLVSIPITSQGPYPNIFKLLNGLWGAFWGFAYFFKAVALFAQNC